MVLKRLSMILLAGAIGALIAGATTLRARHIEGDSTTIEVMHGRDDATIRFGALCGLIVGSALVILDAMPKSK